MGGPQSQEYIEASRVLQRGAITKDHMGPQVLRLPALLQTLAVGHGRLIAVASLSQGAATMPWSSCKAGLELEKGLYEVSRENAFHQSEIGDLQEHR